MKERLFAQSACSGGGSTFCQHLAHATKCVVEGNAFRCSCQSGYEPFGKNESSACFDIDECASGRHECPSKLPKSVCVNTPGSYECVCGPYRRLNRSSCEDIDECLEETESCGKNTKCVNQDGASPLCVCLEGYEGNDSNEKDVDCKDVDECAQPDASTLCPENATCVNTIGSYRCECARGYQMGRDNQCEQIDLCATGQHTCDPYLAECSQTGGTVTCRCKEFFTGSGEVDDCTAEPGHEHLACFLRGHKCSSYEQCVRNTVPGAYHCGSKGRLKQLAVFLSQGGTSETPVWIWILVALGVVLLGVAIRATVSRFGLDSGETSLSAAAE